MDHGWGACRFKETFPVGIILYGGSSNFDFIILFFFRFSIAPSRHFDLESYDAVSSFNGTVHVIFAENDKNRNNSFKMKLTTKYQNKSAVFRYFADILVV